MSIKLASKSKPSVADIASVWLRMGFAMTTVIETVSLRGISNVNKIIVLVLSEPGEHLRTEFTTEIHVYK